METDEAMWQKKKKTQLAVLRRMLDNRIRDLVAFERLQRVLGVEEMKINKLDNEKEKRGCNNSKSNTAFFIFFYFFCATLFQPLALSALPVTLNLCYTEINNTGPPSSKISHLQIPCFPI